MWDLGWRVQETWKPRGGRAQGTLLEVHGEGLVGGEQGWRGLGGQDETLNLYHWKFQAEVMGLHQLLSEEWM